MVHKRRIIPKVKMLKNSDTKKIAPFLYLCFHFCKWQSQSLGDRPNSTIWLKISNYLHASDVTFKTIFSPLFIIWIYFARLLLCFCPLGCKETNSRRCLAKGTASCCSGSCSCLPLAREHQWWAKFVADAGAESLIVFLFHRSLSCSLGFTSSS